MLIIFHRIHLDEFFVLLVTKWRRT